MTAGGQAVAAGFSLRQRHAGRSLRQRHAGRSLRQRHAGRSLRLRVGAASAGRGLPASSCCSEGTCPPDASWRPSGRLLGVLGLLAPVGLGLYIAGMYYRASQQRRAALKALGRHDYLAARNHLNASLDAWPNHPTTHLLLARAARLAGFFEEADRQL